MKPGDMVQTRSKGEHHAFRLRDGEGGTFREVMTPNMIGIVLAIGYYSFERHVSFFDEKHRSSDDIEDVMIMLPTGQTGWVYASLIETVNIVKGSGRIDS